MTKLHESRARLSLSCNKIIFNKTIKLKESVFVL